MAREKKVKKKRGAHLQLSLILRHRPMFHKFIIGHQHFMESPVLCLND